MNQTLTTIIAQAHDMLSQVKAHISPEHAGRLEKKITAWQAAQKYDEENIPAAPLPPLVMRTKGLPKVLDPLYFTLTKNLHDINS